MRSVRSRKVRKVVKTLEEIYKQMDEGMPDTEYEALVFCIMMVKVEACVRVLKKLDERDDDWDESNMWDPSDEK